MKADPKNPGRGVCLYLKEHDRVPEWWREFHSLFHCKDKCLGDVQVQGFAHLQPTAFRLPAAQLGKDGLWTVPPCLGVLGCRDYLPLKDFKGTQDYQEVWHKETVALSMALQRCTVPSRMPLVMLCRAVQELCRCLPM